VLKDGSQPEQPADVEPHVVGQNDEGSFGRQEIHHKFDPNLTEFLEDNQDVARLHITFVKEVFQVAVDRFAPSGYPALQELVLQVNEGDMFVRQRVINWEVGLEMVFRIFPNLQELRLLYWGSFDLVGETRKVGLPNIRQFYLGSSEYESWYRIGVKEGSQAIDELVVALLDMPAVEHLEVLGLVPFVHRPNPFEVYPALLASMPQLKTAVLEHLVRSSKPDLSLRDRMKLICTTQAEWAREEADVRAFAASVHGEWEVEMQRDWSGRNREDVYRVCIYRAAV
jgi:hypothetical protein